MTREQCEKDYAADMAAANAYVKKCMGSAAWGGVGTLGLTVAGGVIGGLKGGAAAGAGGALLGFGIGACLELGHLAHCAGKANEMKKWAKINYDYCMSQATD